MGIDLNEMIKMMHNDEEVKGVIGYYGAKNEHFKECVDDIFTDLVRADKITDVIDKHFKSSDESIRLRVLAFAESLQRFTIYNKAMNTY